MRGGPRELAFIAFCVAVACNKDEGELSPTTTATPSSDKQPSLTPLSEVKVDPEEIISVQGSKMVLNADDTIVSRVIRRDGIWEPLETRVFQQQLQPGDVVIDAGANIGYYTLLAARLVGPEGHVYAFEPEPEAFAILKRNVELNGYTNVTLVDKALGRQAGTLKLFLATKNRGDHRIYNPTGKRSSIQVEVVALDAYLAERGVDRVDFLKIDTQGAECTILEGATATLERHRQLDIVMELTPHSLVQLGDDPRACLERLSRSGYSFQDIKEWDRALVPTDVETLLRAYPAEDRKKFTNILLTRTPPSP